MYGNNLVPLKRDPRHDPTFTTQKVSALYHELDRELSDDEDDALLSARNETADPWRDDFDGYLKSRDQLRAMSIIEWWGVRTQIKYRIIKLNFA